MNDPPKLACRRRKWRKRLVREERLELSRIAPLDPKSSAYASFATLARKSHILQGDEFNTALRRRQEEERPSGACGAGFLRVGEAMGMPFAAALRKLFFVRREGGFSGLEAREKSGTRLRRRKTGGALLFAACGSAARHRSCAARRDGAKGRKRDVRRSGKNPAPSGALRPAAPGRL